MVKKECKDCGKMQIKICEDFNRRKKFRKEFMKLVAKSIRFQKPVFTPEELRLLVQDCLDKGMKVNTINNQGKFGIFNRIKDAEDVWGIGFTWK